MMKRLLILFCLFGLIGCDDSLDVCGPVLSVARTMTKPVVDPPVTSRFNNWTTFRGGSCVWATAATILSTEGRDDLAIKIRDGHGGPVSADVFAAAMRRDGIRLRQDATGGIAFVDRCMSAGKPCGAIVDVFSADETNGDHFVTVVHSDCNEVGFIDPNEPAKIQYVPRADFVAELTRCGGWCFTFDY